MQDVYRVQSISANTRFAGIIQSRADSSPLITAGNAWLSKNAPVARRSAGNRGLQNVANALEVLEERSPFVGYLSHESDGRGICVREQGRDPAGNFENVIDALHWLPKASPA